MARAADNGDFTTVQRYDAIVTPAAHRGRRVLRVPVQRLDGQVCGAERKGGEAGTAAALALKGAKITFNVDADYQVVRTRLTSNVVGIVEGTDPKLKDTYVAFGAHYDHTGFREVGRAGRPDAGDGHDQQRRRR